KHAGGLVTLVVPLIAVGSVRIDFVSIDESRGEQAKLRPALEHPPRSGEVPILPLPELVYMKLKAGRQRDIADVVELLKRGADISAIDRYIADQASEMSPRWLKVKELAAREE